MMRILTIARVVWLEMLRKKDFYVLLILLGVLLFALTSINVFGLGSAVRYVLDLGLLLTWIFSLILVITLTARQLPGEESKGTVYPLLAKPVTRAEVLAGKWLGAWSAATLATVAFYAVLLLAVTLKNGEIDLVALVQAWVMHAVMLCMVAALALALSTRMSSEAAATTSFVAVAASFFLVPRIPVLLLYETGVAAGAMRVLYYALPHFEIFDLRQRVVHQWGAISWGTFSQVLLYGLVVTGAFLLLAWLGYRVKRFRRGGVL